MGDSAASPRVPAISWDESDRELLFACMRPLRLALEAYPAQRVRFGVLQAQLESHFSKLHPGTPSFVTGRRDEPGDCDARLPFLQCFEAAMRTTSLDLRRRAVSLFVASEASYIPLQRLMAMKRAEPGGLGAPTRKEVELLLLTADAMRVILGIWSVEKDPESGEWPAQYGGAAPSRPWTVTGGPLGALATDLLPAACMAARPTAQIVRRLAAEWSPGERDLVLICLDLAAEVAWMRDAFALDF